MSSPLGISSELHHKITFPSQDVKSLNLTPNPLFGKDQTSSIVSAFNDKVQVAPFICPITQKEMNGHSR